MMLTNRQIALRLRKQAMELARGGTNLYRARAFRQAAMTVLGLPEELSVLVATKGERALERLPGVGESLAETIASYLSATKSGKIGFQSIELTLTLCTSYTFTALDPIDSLVCRVGMKPTVDRSR